MMKKSYLIYALLITLTLTITLWGVCQPVTLDILNENNWILKVADGYLLNTKICRNDVKRVKVCVIDSGFDFLDSNISLINIKNATNGEVYGYHGTMIASLIGAKQNKLSNFSGIIPGIDMYVYNLEKEELNTLSLSKAIIEAADKGVDIINLSLSTTLNDDILYNSIMYALNKGITIICSSGNTANEQELYPASYHLEGLISVGAIDKNMNVLPSTTFNNSVNIFAPGEDVFFPNESMKQSGTSLAAPIVTSLVILLKAKYPDLAPKEIEKIIVNTSNEYTANWKYSKRRINVISFKKALSCSR